MCFRLVSVLLSFVLISPLYFSSDYFLYKVCTLVVMFTVGEESYYLRSSVTTLHDFSFFVHAFLFWELRLHEQFVLKGSILSHFSSANVYLPSSLFEEPFFDGTFFTVYHGDVISDSLSDSGIKFSSPPSPTRSRPPTVIGFWKTMVRNILVYWGVWCVFNSNEFYFWFTFWLFYWWLIPYIRLVDHLTPVITSSIKPFHLGRVPTIIRVG